ncbi:MAG: hypothetical protein ABSG84_01315 [Acidobacteriaceae bacterium]|jgi:hypothetical protein
MLELRRLRADIEAPFLPRTIPRRAVRPAFARLACLAALLVAGICAVCAQGQSARFDLIGPRVEVRVTRAGVTLPIASVPNLQPGDRLWLHPDLPPTQSIRYLMVLAFLRGTTNPPPDNWFFRIETWDKKVREEGVEITVPSEAEQAVLFLAPVTGGDFATLRSAVQGRPGIFVRASQDLAAAGFEQARIEKYVESMHELSPEQEADPKQLQEHSNLIAATLALKPNDACTKLPPDQQYTCFTQTGSQTLLDDGHGQTIIDALTGNASAGLIGTASTTQLAGGGLYSSYVGTIVDFVHIMGSLHTAQYQYIPAIAFPQQQSLNLRLNTPPSFHNPKSVIVIGLPSIQQTIPPPLRAADPKQIACLQKPGVVLQVEGAPLVFSTGFAHDLVLHLNYPGGAKPDAAEKQDIPLTADAFRGGLVLATIPKRHALPNPAAKVSLPTSPVDASDPASENGPPAASAAGVDAITGAELTGTVQGFWGFETFTGPTLPLQETPGKDWKLADGDPLIAGKDRHIVIASTGTACIQSIALDPASGKQEKETWKPADKPNSVEVTLDLPAHDAGEQHLAIRQFGDPKPATLSLVSYNLPAKLDALNFHAGDTTATLAGTSLDQVRQVGFGGLSFKPVEQGTTPELQPGGRSELHLSLPTDAKPPALPAGERLTAEVALEDGRTLKLPLTVEAARPSITVIARADVPPDTEPKPPFFIKFASQADLPVDDALMFSLKSAQPFPRNGEIEIASPDGSLHTKLGVDSGSLILEDPQTLLATLRPLKAFGPSAFGPIRLRAVAADGTAGEWLPLVTLVRLPTITGLSCPVAEPAGPVAPTTPAAPTPSTPPCTLTGSGLYFIDSVAADESFAKPTRVPEGFVGSSLQVPPPTGAQYYLRLRDDPTTTDTITLPAGPL